MRSLIRQSSSKVWRKWKVNHAQIGTGNSTVQASSVVAGRRFGTIKSDDDENDNDKPIFDDDYVNSLTQTPSSSTSSSSSVLQLPKNNNMTFRSFSTDRPDPFARRPTKKCDPYGQGGKPLSREDAERLLTTVSPEWKLQARDGDEGKENDSDNYDDHDDFFPTILAREFYHSDFLSGSSFVTTVAAVSQMNDHYPTIRLERRLDSRNKSWNVISTVQFHTKVLQGLSHHDFFLATLIDVEIERPEVRSLLLSDSS